MSQAPAASPSPRFVHLRVHSEYSVVDSIVRIDALAEAAAADAQPAVALTDLGNLFGWVKFYKAARSQGVKPICGVDAWITNDDDRDKPHRLLLLARDRTGYLRLCELLTRAWLENEYRGRGEMRRDWFADERGLIALSGAQAGDVGCCLDAGNLAHAEQLARDWAARFPGAYYIELQRTGTPEAERHVRAAARLAARLGLPAVATHPVQFLRPDEHRAHEARVCIAEGEILANPRRVRRFTEQQYFRSQAEMAELFADLPAALANSVEIARRCSLELELGKPKLPLFPTPDGVTLDDYMRQLAREGLDRRLIKLFPDERERQARREQYAARLEYECDTIVQMGFSGYFLIVADFINWAKDNAVPVGPGRGSGAGSIVAYALGITDLDPIPYALLFERFLNPERVSMPDFDIDFCQDNRWRVIEYVRNKYGAQAVSQIATFGTMASKAVIRDAGRVLDMPYHFCDQLSKLIPIVQAKPLSLAKAREAEPLLREREEKEEEVRALLALAAPLEDVARNVGMHAGGVLIAPGRLTDFCPLYRAPGTDSVVSQYDKDDVEAVGLVKFDFLGLRNLTILQLAVDYVNRRRQEEGDPERLDLSTLTFDDPLAYKILRDANTTAIFQVESDGMKKLLKKLGPDRFEDIIAVLALYRPGPLNSGMVDDFILRKKGQQRIDYFHPDLTACLEPTYGVIVYQEQVMQISQIIGGYTLGGADLLRRAMGKKKAEEMAQQRQVFLDGAKKKGYDPALADTLFGLMEQFAEYGFNKSHTAAYAVVTYHTAWLKAHYPAEFMAATLSSDMDDTDKVQVFVADAKANMVPVLPPDINASNLRFEAVDHAPGAEGRPGQVGQPGQAGQPGQVGQFGQIGQVGRSGQVAPPGPDRQARPARRLRAIRYGLGAVKGAGEGAVLEILKARESGGPFACLYDFCARVDRRTVNRRAIEALIKAGAFDALDVNRAKLLANVARAIESAEQRGAHADQVSLFGGDESVSPPPAEWIDAPAWPERQRLQEEKAALGFYLSGHLFHAHAAEVRRFVRTRLADLAPSRDPVWIAGIVAGLRTQMTRRGKMVVLTLDDDSAKVEVPVFNELYEAHRSMLREDELMFVQGRVQKDEYTGGVRITADRVCDLAEARAIFAKRLRVRLNGVATGEAVRAAIEPFSRAVRDGAGGVPVVLEYGNARASVAVELGAQWRVRPTDDLFEAVRATLHPQQVALEY